MNAHSWYSQIGEDTIRPTTNMIFRCRKNPSNSPFTTRVQPWVPSSRFCCGILQKGRSMKCHTGVKKIQPTTMPRASPSRALSRRLRSSRMCSMSGIRASGFSSLVWRGMRGPRACGGAPESGGELISRRHSAGLVGALGLGERHPVHQGAVVLDRSRRRQLLRRGRLGLSRLALGRLALGGLAVVGLLVSVEPTRLRLEDTHGTAESPGAVGQFLGPEE